MMSTAEQPTSLPSGCKAVQLFGGAMSSVVGLRYADVSTFRQVPDAQEVFVDTVGEGSLTLELLERQEGTDEAAMRALWDDAVGEDDDSGVTAKDLGGNQLEQLQSVQRSSVAPGFAAASAAVSASGWMWAGKFNEDDETSRRLVFVEMLLLRLKAFDTDMLLSYNLPEPPPPSTATTTTTTTPTTTIAVPSLEPEPEPESKSEAEAATGNAGRARIWTHLDILSAYYAQHDPSKTTEAIAKILSKRDDGGPFWWPRLAGSLADKYSEAPGLWCVSGKEQEGLVRATKTEAKTMLGLFAKHCKLLDQGLFITTSFKTPS